MTTPQPRCPALHPDLPYSRCTSEEGHLGEHANTAGNLWDEREHIGPEGETDWHGLYLAENRRAETAEAERDMLLDDLRKAEARAETAEYELSHLHQRHYAVEQERDEAIKRAKKAEEEWKSAVESIKEANALINDMRAEMHACDVHNGVVIPEVTDEMVERGRARYVQEVGGGHAGLIREVLIAALTEPPARPDWQDLSDTLRDIDHVVALSIDELAKAAYERGVRVVGEERS